MTHFHKDCIAYGYMPTLGWVFSNIYQEHAIKKYFRKRSMEYDNNYEILDQASMGMD